MLLKRITAAGKRGTESERISQQAISVTSEKDTKIWDSTNCTKNVDIWEKWIKSYTLYPHTGRLKNPVN